VKPGKSEPEEPNHISSSPVPQTTVHVSVRPIGLLVFDDDFRNLRSYRILA
jgi:hypothetical protein